jgi:integrase
MPKKNRRQWGEGALFQRGDGRWVARVDLGWRAGRERRHEFYGHTPEDALQKRRVWLRDRDQGFTPPKGRAPTMGDWLRHWGTYVAQPRVRPTTWYAGYRSKIAHLITYFDKIRLTNEEVDEELIEEFHAHLLAQGMSPSSVVSIHRILSSALKEAVIQELVKHVG